MIASWLIELFDEIADNMLIITGSCWVIYSVLLIHKKHEESQSQILTATFEVYITLQNNFHNLIFFSSFNLYLILLSKKHSIYFCILWKRKTKISTKIPGFSCYWISGMIRELYSVYATINCSIFPIVFIKIKFSFLFGSAYVLSYK